MNSLISHIIGVGADNEVLGAKVKITISDDCRKVKFKITNVSPVHVINKIVLNFYPTLEGKPILINDINKSHWSLIQEPDYEVFGKEEQYLFDLKIQVSDENQMVKPQETLQFTLLFEDNADSFSEKSFLTNNQTEMDRKFPIGIAFMKSGLECSENSVVPGYIMRAPCVKMTPPPSLPIPNPQTCCQLFVKGSTQLVGPALYNPNQCDLYPVTYKKYLKTWIVKVCPEKVIVGGYIKLIISYSMLDDSCNLIEEQTINEIPFECMIERYDANEGDYFDIVGAAILCDVEAKPANFGTHHGCNMPVAWNFVTKDIVKICIRKRLYL